MNRLDRALMVKELVDSSELIDEKKLKVSDRKAYIVGAPGKHSEGSKCYTCTMCKEERIYCDKANSGLIDKGFATPLCMVCFMIMAGNNPGAVKFSMLKENRESINKIVGKALDEAIGDELG